MESLKGSSQIGSPRAFKGSFLRADIAVIAIIVFLGIGFVNFISLGNAPYVSAVKIETDLSVLPTYALLSLTRSFIALGFSYIFAIIYGTLAARSPAFERIMIPLVDVLQSLPVVAFLPGFVLALVAIFHDSRWGLEIACVLTIFTGQVWSLVFAYYESQRTLPTEFKQVGIIYKLSAMQKFLRIDLPNGSRYLIYNGMVAMAGGWFFLATCESFTLGEQDFRLPGLGSYLSETFAQGMYTNFAVGIFVLLLAIVGTDFLLWRPLVVWVSRFSEHDANENIHETENSWFLNLIRITRIPQLGHLAVSTLVHLPLWSWGKQNVRSPFTDGWHVMVNTKSFFKNDRWLRPVVRNFRAWMMPLLTFAVGGLVFTLLPHLPDFAQSLTRLSQQDWLDLIRGVLYTGSKVVIVLVMTTLWALPLGLWLGLNPKIERIVQPIIQNLAAFPAPVLFPLVALVLNSLGVSAFIISAVLMTLGSQWYILFNVLGGAARVPADLKMVATVYRLPLLTRCRKLYGPAVMPSLVTGLISAAGGAWNASIVAEIVTFPGGTLDTHGIGSELAKASAQGHYQKLVAAIVCLVVVLVIVNRTVWRTLQARADNSKD